jgi:N-acetylmuramoyl-L-alanine amidase
MATDLHYRGASRVNQSDDSVQRFARRHLTVDEAGTADCNRPGVRRRSGDLPRHGALMRRRLSGLLAALVLTTAAGCGSTHRNGAAQAPSHPSPTAAAAPMTAPSTATTTVAPKTVPPVPTIRAPTPTSTTVAQAASIPSTGPSGGPGRFPPDGSGVLDGKIVAVDPGHNGGNFTDPRFINQLIFNGRESEACDTTGTETDAGYTEALFTWNVARYLTADLRSEGATVVLTRTSNTGVGPCVTERAAIGNNAHANAAVSIHADGGPPGGRGFTILEPVADGPNDAIVGPSRILGADLRQAFAAGTGEPISDYYGTDGIAARDDLGGINLSTVPKVFVECANMRNATDASLVITAAWQLRAAHAIAAGISAFLTTSG